MNAADTIFGEPGTNLPEHTLPPVTRLDLIRYAGASGDFNPIHTIDEAAAQAGLPGVIQHGMLTMARIGAIFSPYLDRGYIQSFETRFVGMVQVGDSLTIGGKYLANEAHEEGTIHSFELVARNQRGQDVATCTASFLAFRDG